VIPVKLTVLIVGLMFGASAFGAETGAKLFQKAVTQERAAGNLEEAIRLYRRVATEFASDRALAAMALVQEARCYENLGKINGVLGKCPLSPVTETLEPPAWLDRPLRPMIDPCRPARV
jgi:hypothetical protein